MKSDLITSLAAAVCLHAVILVGLRSGTFARPQPMTTTDASTVDVSFIDPAPAPATTPVPVTAEPPFRVPFEPQSTSEPDQPPAPVADVAPLLPARMLSQEVLPTPPIPASPGAPRHIRSRIPHSAPGRASELAHTSGSAGPGVPAHTLSNPRPEYPDAARRMRQQGVVTLDILVSADGAAGDVTVVRSSGYPLLDHAAEDAVRRWTFEPARSAGMPIASHVQLPIRFSLTD